MNEKIKKGYSGSGAVTLPNLAKTTTRKNSVRKKEVSDMVAILAEYDAIIKQKDTTLVLPFPVKYAKCKSLPQKRKWLRIK